MPVPGCQSRQVVDLLHSLEAAKERLWSCCQQYKAVSGASDMAASGHPHAKGSGDNM